MKVQICSRGEAVLGMIGMTLKKAKLLTLC
jgi:hypothetical protein